MCRSEVGNQDHPCVAIERQYGRRVVPAAVVTKDNVNDYEQYAFN